MKDLVSKECAVFYVDILGMGALTNGDIQLCDNDLIPWLNEDEYPIVYRKWFAGNDNNYRSQFLAASILVEFRRILMALGEKYKNVRVAQLSDGAFAWSEDSDDVVFFAANFMAESVKNGLLCRGGLAYGDIVETNETHALGRLIVGKAVTDAVNLEKTAKGTRIFATEWFCKYAQHASCIMFSEEKSPLFGWVTNPLDFNSYYEFKWYIKPDIDENSQALKTIYSEENVKITRERLKLAWIIVCSPKFRWNCKSKEGKIQIDSSIKSIFEDGLLGVHHRSCFSPPAFEPKERSNERLEYYIKSVDTHKFFHRKKHLKDQSCISF